MSVPIFNREFSHPEDGYYCIEPKGEHVNRAAGVTQVIDDVASASIVDAFNRMAAAPKFPGMLVDHEHFKLDSTRESRAYGWLMRLQNRADGIYGQVKWTSTGRAAVDGGDYRFFSTEYDSSDLVVLNSGSPQRVRPMKLNGLSLTNMPNNKGGEPITNREGASAENPADAGREFSTIVNRIKGERKVDFSQAWNFARGEYPNLFAAMAGSQPEPVRPVVLNIQRREATPQLMGEVVLALAQAEQRAHGGSFEQHWHRLQNRVPTFFRVMNRDAETGSLALLEMQAHAAYMRAVQGEGFPTEHKALAKAVDEMKPQFPELGHDGRWEKLKELYPLLFWKFVASFDGAIS